MPLASSHGSLPGPVQPYHAAGPSASTPEPNEAALREGTAPLRLLQFLLDAESPDAVLQRAVASLGLLPEILWAELDGGDDGDVSITLSEAGTANHLIALRLADPDDARARADVTMLLQLVARLFRREAALLRAHADATTDLLTGLFNRRGLEPLLEQALARSARTGEEISMLMVDIDHFKTVNDELGHAAGDRALQEVAAALRSAIRPTDVAVRLGGDEFAVLLAGANATGAMVVCDRVRRALARANSLAPRPLTVSIGVADLSVLERPGAGPAARAAVMAAADAALYMAKANGRDRAACHPGVAACAYVADDSTQPICVAAS
ncbi:MAG: GGDEF domain-containing protein [Deltaproteobacteria bacterium]|nr:GGDEF domain-containing protein [Nannocystaceae bacterium]